MDERQKLVGHRAPNRSHDRARPMEAGFPRRQVAGGKSCDKSQHSKASADSSRTRPFVIRHSSFVIFLLLLLPISAAHASVGDALENYQRGKYSKARAEFERLAKKSPDDARLRFNAGAAAFQDESYEDALRHFSAGLSSTDLKLQQRSYYNLGNTQFRLGERATDAKEKQQTWEQSIHDYENALKLGTNDTDAKFNLDVVKQKLEELKKQKQEQKQEQQSNDDKKDENKDEQKKDQEKQDQQKQDKKDGQDQKQQEKSDQEKKDEESKQQQKQQDQAKSDEQKKQEQKDQQSAQDQRGQEPDEKAQAAQYSKVMQMTPQQAMQLLEAQKANEKAMVFTPQTLRTNRNPNRVFKDW